MGAYLLNLLLDRCSSKLRQNKKLVNYFFRFAALQTKKICLAAPKLANIHKSSINREELKSIF